MVEAEGHLGLVHEHAHEVAGLGEGGVDLLDDQVLLQALGDGYLTNDWIQMNQSLFSALWLEKTAIAVTIGLIVMVAALNIVATLVLMVMEKHQDIAILSP
jgi:ABC-type lipoprotein release transport system permease subunit